MGTFSRLELENFKSYRLRTTIEWKQVSTILGQNGTGKSTIVDAVEYVFCFPRYTKRSVESLRKELYNRNSDENEHSSSWVSATIDINNQKKEFKRSVDYNDLVHKYWVNNEAVGLNEYKKLLLGLNVNSKANNFLVQQNTIESLALKNAKQRREFFEILSNSIIHKSEYDRLINEMKSMESKVNSLQNTLNLQKKEKNILIQKNMEIKMYDELSQQLEEVEYKYYYTKLYKYKKLIDNLLSEQQKKQKIIRITQRLSNENKENIKKLKSQINEKRKEVLDIEQILESDESERLSCEAKGTELSHKILCSENQIKKVDELLKKAKELHKARNKKIEDLEEQLHEIQININELQSQSCSFDVDSNQYDEYISLKAEAQKIFAKANLPVSTLKRQYNSIQDQISEYKNEKERLLYEIKIKESALQDIISQNRNMVKKIEEMQSDIKSAEIDEAKLDKGTNQLRVDIEDILNSIQDLTEKLNDFDITRQESSRHCRNIEILDALKAQFSGVMGRLVQLCRVTEERYEIAITKILGYKMDGIVVDTTDTAKKCIKFLKEQYENDRHSVIETFYPLDNLKVKTLSEYILSEIKRTPYAKLSIDAMDVRQVDIVLKSFIGNIVICETDVQAEEFSRLQKVDCVSLDGTYYKKDGTFSGGCSDMRRRAKKWNEEEYERVEKDKQDKTETLKRLQQQIRDKENLKKDLQIKLSKSRHCLNEYLKPAQKDYEKKLKEKENDLEKSKFKLENFDLSSSINELKETLSSMEHQLKDIKAREDEIEDKVFSGFCKKYGLENIRQYEANDVRKHEERYKYRMALDNHLGEIKNQIYYEKSRNTEEMVKRYKGKKDELKRGHEKLLSEKKEWEERKKERNQYCESKAKIKSLRSEINKIEKKLENEERKLSAANKDLKALEKTVAVYTSKINQFRRLEIHQILTQCKVKGIEIPLQEGTIEKVLVQSRIDIESESSGQQAESDSAIQEKDVEFDFSGLDESIKNLDDDELNVHIKSLEDKYKEFEKKLESCVPSNRNIKDDFKLLENKIKDTKKDLSTKREQYKTIKKEFEDVKNKRGKLFIDFFNSVEKEIDRTFKRLYKDPAAQAFINMINPDEPYLNNIDFNCLIPRKKFTKVENLSGGERTMCALALFLAIYSAKPAPCIIFDEIDVALDNENMENIVSFITEWKEARKTQIIIISHHERLLRCANAVIGINISTRKNSSYAVHVDLAQYLQPINVTSRHLVADHATNEFS